ncbi:MAG: SRPBCC family protein [Acidimicrobiales bacterium]
MAERKRHDTVSIDVASPPDRVYELVSDIGRMGEWSPECYHCAWAKGATVPAVGARFKARNRGRRGPSWFNTPVVTAAEPGREFAFSRGGPRIGIYTWRYVFEPTPTGTRVTESFDVEVPLPKLLSWLTEKWTGSTDRDADLHEGMETTLARIKAAAEAT